jgi:phosphoribosyl 1,2-cyclic phosphodiesterase
VVDIRFHGVRGSTPCSGEATIRYGGNTSCVSVHNGDEPPFLFDLGTGLRYFGAGWPADRTFHGTALLTHLHWDHVQGLPFFVPLLRESASLDVYGPAQDDGRSVAEAFDIFMRPPYFPVTLDHLGGAVSFSDVADEKFKVGRAAVMSRLVPHCGPTLGYRLTWDGVSVAYLSDHQQPADGSMRVSPGALELCEDADLVIHDAQYTPAEFERKKTWGHCTVEFAVRVAHEAGAKRLALFHHDPLRNDDALDAVAVHSTKLAECLGIELVVASEGLALNLS